MTNESKNRWSVIINIALTTLTALLSALGFCVGWGGPGAPLQTECGAKRRAGRRNREQITVEQ